jgi:hypothetical protein
MVFHESDGEVDLLYPSGTQNVGKTDGSTEGLGDIMLLSKYRLAQGSDWTWSLAGQLKFPTGDEDKYLGTGETDFWIKTLLTKRFGALETNFDLGYTFNGFGKDYNSLNYRAAVAYGLSNSVTLVGELIGSESDETVFDTLDAGLGVKINPAGGWVLQAGVRFPLDDDGLRADVIPSVGFEWRF